MRKENIGRLLLTLLTAFVMVAGVFGAAVNSTITSVESPSTPAVDSAQDMNTREMGDMPISAFSEQQVETMAANAEDVNMPTLEGASEVEHVKETPANSGVSSFSQGTRATGVNAYGPYGTEAAPYFEGDPVAFESDMIGGNNADFYFRWDVNSDGIYEKDDFGVTKGDSDYTHTFLDNHIGQATVEAWDGVSYKYVFGGGFPVGDQKDYYETHWSWINYWTIGYKFTLNQDVTIEQLGMFRSYRPYQVYNIRIWTEGGSLVTQKLNPSPLPSYDWRYWSITPTPLTAGNYVISLYFRGYYMPAVYGLQNTPDGVFEFGSTVYTSGNNFPTNQLGDPRPMVDLEYSYAYSVPDVLIGQADVYVDNNAPIPVNLKALPAVGQEGSEVVFTGAFFDTGLNDEWWYRWDFGDGTVSGWRKVIKYSGGANVLLLHSLGANYIDDMVDYITAACGNFLIGFDQWGFGPLGENALPDYDYLLSYHVILLGTNYFVAESRMMELGDMLADRADETGGGTILTDACAWGANNAGIGGRWDTDGYSPIGRAYFNYGWQNMGTVYDPGHPIMQGVGNVRAYYKHALTGVTSGATQLADYANGVILAATRENPVVPNGARIAFCNFFLGGYQAIGSLDTTDDWDVMIANAIRWTSRRPDPQILPMPIPTDPVKHIYVDDHPTHVTDTDVFQAELQVRDDDHNELKPGGITIYEDDFSTNKGWSMQGYWEIDALGSGSSGYNGADPTEDHTDTSDNQAMGTQVPGTFWEYGVNRATTSPVIDCTGYSIIKLEYYKHDHTDYKNYQHWYFEVKDTAGNWIELWTGYVSPGSNSPEWEFMEFDVGPYAADNPNFQVRWRYVNNAGVFTVAGSNLDDLYIWTSVPYEGLGTAQTPVTIANQFPYAVVPPDLVTLTDESVTIQFEGLEIGDAALKEETEEFWYKMIWDDGQESPWIYKGVIAPPKLKILYMHTYSFGAIGGVIAPIQAYMPEAQIDEWDLYASGAPSLSVLTPYDVVVVGTNYVPPNVAAGNVLADYADTGGGVVELVATFYNGIFGFSGRWRSGGYSTFQLGGIGSGSTVTDIFDPTHPIIDGAFETITTWGCSLPISTFGVTPGAVLLADYSSYRAAAYFDETNPDNPSAGRTAGLNIFALSGYKSGQADAVMANAIWWASQIVMPTPVLPTVEHTYGDNGVYNVNLQIIDDDMRWDWTSGQPVFQGPGNPDDWISHNIIPISIDNVDPVVSPIEAFVSADLCLRMSGNKHNTATLRLMENGANVGEITVLRDPGAPDVGVLPVILDMTKGHDYSVEVEYDPDDLAGANPTWIFDTHWPDGKIKTLKHTFNSNDPSDRVWVIPNLKSFMLGHDVIFGAWASDQGSDDLAFIWGWGDSTPYGIHIYANADSSTATEAVSDEATLIFNQDPDRDPWFDKMPNTERSPETNPIRVKDTISHVFDVGQPYYYYVTCTVLDDDNGDGYPSPYLNGGGYDMDFVEIDFR